MLKPKSETANTTVQYSSGGPRYQVSRHSDTCMDLILKNTLQIHIVLWRSESCFLSFLCNNSNMIVSFLTVTVKIGDLTWQFERFIPNKLKPSSIQIWIELPSSHFNYYRTFYPDIKAVFQNMKTGQKWNGVCISAILTISTQILEQHTRPIFTSPSVLEVRTQTWPQIFNIGRVHTIFRGDIF